MEMVTALQYSSQLARGCAQAQAGDRLSDPEWWTDQLFAPVRREMIAEQLTDDELLLMHELFGEDWEPTSSEVRATLHATV